MRGYDAEVIIVGSGVAGAITAWKLAQQGIKVIVLEAGPYLPDRDEMVKALRAAGPAQTINTPYPNSPQAPRPNAMDNSNYYIQTGPEKFYSTFERVVGGTTWHWLGLCPRLLPDDFAMHSHYQVATDWPLTYSEIEPYYVKAEHVLSVSGDSGINYGSPRSAEFSNPPIKQTYTDKVIASHIDGTSFKGKRLFVQNIPQARQPWCQGSGSCIPLCPTGAKYEANTHVELAKKLGAVVISKAVVNRVIEKNGKVHSIKYLDWKGNEHGLKAKYYVLAANAIETPKILLMSSSKSCPNGLANASGMVGRNLMDHIWVVGNALSKEPVYGFRGPQVTCSIDTMRNGNFRCFSSAYRINILNCGWWVPNQSPYSDLKQVSKNVVEFNNQRQTLKRKLERQMCLGADVEMLPHVKNQVSLSNSHVDALGIPRPELFYHFTDYERKGINGAKRCLNFIFQTMKATEITQLQQPSGSGHIMGTCKMGNDPSTSVVDRNCRTHECSNLFILGSSVFPTAGTANPTLTIVALVLRAADLLVNELRSK
ncbi:GMC family oxidoreductase [Parashewanella tropica]|uniref:GMC family oxidoreductase n=1 Tax=Parashewanella tropica TaxID=2547970 RepID=UPI0010599BAC|nr:GMC family oxidoreductase [Parashewanella tropica]